MPETTKPEKDEAVMHTFKERKSSSSSLFTTPVIVLLIVIALLGVGSGYMLAKHGGKTGIASLDKVANTSHLEKGKTYGNGDTATFKDTAEGTMRDGGIDGEGTNHLVRPGGDSQSVYLTSSSVDLSQFIGRKVKVWGQTQTAQKAGWLMDVGRVQVLD